ncbi:MAG: 2-succinyl-5-enolpyruvyl-6-hydroxy-3-cyclohexene-carboxylate synthase [Frankiaceae bacterium]|nr:2-succinyl-5-enolpyruvyl-6-hydroxy-3-cyclohexene-carboxylate synthase [Frankiaceae bacterium]
MPGGDTTARNAGHAFALVVVDELVRHGVTDAVLAPGSRSTPIALALADHPSIRLHVRIDERSAAFLALGLARTTSRPVPVLCTSGTAAAHFHAAVLEADQSRVPLLLLTADRPPELRGVGANQTIDQTGLYGTAVRWSCDVGVPESRPDSVRHWRSLVSRAVAVLTGASGGPAGPVHLNLALREPLTPADDGVGFPHSLAGRAGGSPWTASARIAAPPPPELVQRIAAADRGVVVAGDGLSSADAEALVAFADRAGWPLIAEPHSNARRGPGALRGSDALLANERFVSTHVPELVIVSGRLGLSRALSTWLAATPHVVVDRDGSWWDPTRTSAAVFRCDAETLAAVAVVGDPHWRSEWLAAAGSVTSAIDGVLDETNTLTEPRVARDVAALLPSGATLVVASSMPIRDLDLTMAPREGLRVIANRGVSGIDGFVSTATGVALAHDGPTYALTGDLSLLHDVNGLLGPAHADITFVVVNNDGGGIFSLLPQSGSDDDTTFERLFGTPHGVDLARLAAAYDVGHCHVRTASELATALAAPPRGVRLVEVRTDRRENAALHDRLRAAGAAALA